MAASSVAWVPVSPSSCVASVLSSAELDEPDEPAELDDVAEAVEAADADEDGVAAALESSAPPWPRPQTAAQKAASPVAPATATPRRIWLMRRRRSMSRRMAAEAQARVRARLSVLPGTAVARPRAQSGSCTSDYGAVPSAWISRRTALRLGTAAGSDRPELALFAQIAGPVFLGGAALIALAFALPHDPYVEWVVVADFFLCLATGIGLIVAFDRTPAWAQHASVLIGILAITAAIMAAHRATSHGAVVYLWNVLCTFTFLSRRMAFGYLALAVAALGVAQALESDDMTWVSAWIISAMTLAMVGVLVGTLTDRLRQALGRSQDEAGTDALTGLANRRRLLLDLDAIERDPRPALLVLFDLNGFKAYNDAYGHPAGDALLARVGERLQTAVQEAGRAYRLGGDEFCALLEGDDARVDRLVLMATEALVETGATFAVDSEHGVVALPREADTAQEALRLADRRMYRRKQPRRSGAGGEVRAVLLEALSGRQDGLDRHVDGVAALVSEVAAQLELPRDEQQLAVRAAEFHDLGKLAVPDSILLKDGPLDEAEWRVMRTHTITGERILSASTSMAEVASIVRSCHERFDGGGYPDGLRGDAIALAARIVFACDAFDAMTSDRAYRHALDEAEALAELVACAGTQFDPEVVAALCAVRAAVPQAA